MVQRIIQLWRFLRKSREEKKEELAKHSLDLFKALVALNSAEKQEMYPYVKDLYNDLMEIEVLRFKVDLIANPLLYLFSFFVWGLVMGSIIGILDALLSFLFSTNLHNIQSFLDTQSRNGNVWAAIVALCFFMGGFFLWLFVSLAITGLFLEPILSAYFSAHFRFFERLRNRRYPVASLVNKLIWILHYAERYRMSECVGFPWRALVTVIEWDGKQKIRTPLCILVTRDQNNHISYSPRLISNKRDPKTSEQLGKETTNIEKAYRAIAEAVLERKLTVEELMPFPKEEGEEEEKVERKLTSRTKILAEYKQYQLSLLEGAARCLERYVPRRFRCGDSVTDYWLKETFQLAAAALREKKTWILTPKEDTYKYFISSIRDTLIHAIKDNWDALERVEMEELIKRQKLARAQLWRFRLIVLLRAVFVAILPVAGFIILQLTPLAITGATRTYVIVGLFIWVGLSALALLDSDLEKKLGMANSVKSLLSFPGKEGP